MSKEKPTFAPGRASVLFNALNESPLAAKFDLRSVKACISRAAPLADRGRGTVRRDHRRGEARRGLRAFARMPSACDALGPRWTRRRAGSERHAVMPSTLRLQDRRSGGPRTWSLEPGERGELPIRGPQAMPSGYLNRPEETACSRSATGGSTPRLSGRRILDGYFPHRRPAQGDDPGLGVQRVPERDRGRSAYRHLKISKVAVIAPDDKTEVVKAFSVLREGESATIEELVTWARDPGERPLPRV